VEEYQNHDIQKKYLDHEYPDIRNRTKIDLIME
jgi:hypothetical protein